MTTYMLVWNKARDSYAGPDSLRSASLFRCEGREPKFRKVAAPGALLDLAIHAVDGAMKQEGEIMIAWSTNVAEPNDTSVYRIDEMTFRQARGTLAPPQHVGTSRFEDQWTTFFLLSGRLNLPDIVFNSVAGDANVRAANLQWVRANPISRRPLIAATLAAQASLGIPEQDRAPLHSDEVEEVLVPLLSRFDTGEEVVRLTRAKLRELYGEFAGTVLAFMLRTYTKPFVTDEMLQEFARQHSVEH
jgi:hypothetical protein